MEKVKPLETLTQIRLAGYRLHAQTKKGDLSADDSIELHGILREEFIKSAEANGLPVVCVKQRQEG